MTLSDGTRLGPYEIRAMLGAGGMGEVYRAQDLRLGREVAVKVLPSDREFDPGRRARFAQEARTISALNHPSIVTIHEIESADGVDFIVMELVPGKTLDALIPRQGLRLGEALRIAIPMADALAAAHAAGIVHRDLKPANVMVAPDGTVKVLDFGLAKLILASRGDLGDIDHAPTVDARFVSRVGTVAGTLGYMSPEQAVGGEVDARSDVFSFGAVLYEMITGRRAFSGDSGAEMLAAVLKQDPKPPSQLTFDVPRDLDRIVMRCLRKDAARRFQSMLDVKVELLEVKEESDSVPTPAASKRRRLAWPWLSAAALVVLGTGALVVRWLPASKAPSPRLSALTTSRHAGAGTLSPDGTQVAFESQTEDGGWDIWLKMVGDASARRLTTDPANDVSPTWSPDARQIAFVRSASGSPSGVWIVPAVAGPERKLRDFPVRDQLAWSRDGRWIAAARLREEGEGRPESGGIHLIPADGRAPWPVTFPKRPAYDCQPAFSPDGRSLAFATCETILPACDVYTVELDEEGRAVGTPRRQTSEHSWNAGVTWGGDGRSLVYATEGPGTAWLWRVRPGRDAAAERIELAGSGAYWPSGAASRLVFTRLLMDHDIYRLGPGNAATPLIESSSFDYNPQYSPDGERIAFTSGRSGEAVEVWLTDAKGLRPVQLTHGPGRLQGSPRWSPDGQRIAFDSQSEDGRWDVWLVAADGGDLTRLTSDPSDDNLPSWSHDGQWIYFSSLRTGRHEIWRAPAQGGPEEQVTRDGGFLAFEDGDGGTLFYTKTNGPAPLFGRPLEGGTERQVVDCVRHFGFAPAPGGLVYLPCPAPGEPPDGAAEGHTVKVHFRETATGTDRALGTIDTGSGDSLGLSASPDGRSILFTRFTESSDLVLIDGFR